MVQLMGSLLLQEALLLVLLRIPVALLSLGWKRSQTCLSLTHDVTLSRQVPLLSEPQFSLLLNGASGPCLRVTALRY